MPDEDDRPKTFGAAGLAAIKEYAKAKAERDKRLLETLGRAVAPQRVEQTNDDEGDR